MRLAVASILVLSLFPSPSNEAGRVEEVKRLSVEVPLGMLTITSYQSVPHQTDNSPFITSIGERTNRLGVAVSRDLLCGVSKRCRRNVSPVCNPNKIHYGDVLWIEPVGFRQVFDTMNKRHTQAVDLWVSSYAEERAFHKKWGIRKHRVVLIRKQI